MAKENESIDTFPEEYYSKDLSSFLGNANTIQKMEKIFYNILGRQKFLDAGIKPARSYLFYGLPGTGKNHGIECIVGELLKRDINLWVREFSVGREGSVYVDGGSKKAQKFFDDSKEIILPGTGIDHLIYVFDEAEQILRDRTSNSNQSEDQKRLTTIMTNLQRIYNSDSPEYLFFITNKPKIMDKASIRTRRVDDIIEFKLPTLEARAILFERAITQINKKARTRLIHKYNIQELAEFSEGFNCADCLDIPDRVVRDQVLKHLADTDSNLKESIDQKKLLNKVAEQRERYGKTTKAIQRSVGFQFPESE